MRLTGTVVFAALVIGAAWWFGRSGDSPATRYKMTVEVMTPAGLKIGSAVRETRVRANDGGWFPFGESRPSVDFQGEAVTVDVAPGQTLFALLESEDGDLDYAKRIPDRLIGSSTPLDIVDGKARSVELWPSKPDSVKYVRRSSVPLLVRFNDEKDPHSIQLVRKSDLTSAFSPGATLRRISVETTREPVTKGIRVRLPWLANDRLVILSNEQNNSSDFRDLTTVTRLSFEESFQ